MGKNYLIDALRSNQKKGTNYFDNNAAVLSYKTGFPVLDYYLGYNVMCYNQDDELVTTYPNIGIQAGSFVTFIGKPSTSKTTTAIQVAANIVRPFDNGTVIHFDLEQAINYSRIKALTNFKMTEMNAGKYILRQEMSSITDIKKTIMEVYLEKKAHPDQYIYDTEKVDEFNNPIKLFEPTVVIIDSIASLATELDENKKDDAEKLREVSSQTDRMRLTGEIGRFFTELLPYLRAGNIIVIAINHIKEAPQGLVKRSSDIYYLGQNETLNPRGKAA